MMPWWASDRWRRCTWRRKGCLADAVVVYADTHGRMHGRCAKHPMRCYMYPIEVIRAEAERDGAEAALRVIAGGELPSFIEDEGARVWASLPRRTPKRGVK